MAVDKHKLNTPLTAIYGYVQMLELKSENLTDAQKKWVEEMKKETQRLIEMIKEL
jgi:signal transduction histidine kinase